MPLSWPDGLELPADGASKKAWRRYCHARALAIESSEAAWTSLFAPSSAGAAGAEEAGVAGPVSEARSPEEGPNPFAALDRALGESLHTGAIRPHAFGSAHATAAYAERRFARRARFLAEALLHEACAREVLRSCFAGGPEVRVASVGGGPASDFAACALVASLAPRLLGTGAPPPAVCCTVLDNEAAWRPCVEAVDAALGGPGRGGASLEPCDVTAPLEAPSNARLRAEAARARLVTFCYVLHENEAALTAEGAAAAAAAAAAGPEEEKQEEGRPRLGGALPGVLAAAAPGAAVVALDASGRLWPAFARAAEAAAPGGWRGWALHAHAHQHGLLLLRGHAAAEPPLEEQLGSELAAWSAQYALYRAARRAPGP